MFQLSSFRHLQIQMGDAHKKKADCWPRREPPVVISLHSNLKRLLCADIQKCTFGAVSHQTKSGDLVYTNQLSKCDIVRPVRFWRSFVLLPCYILPKCFNELLIFTSSPALDVYIHYNTLCLSLALIYRQCSNSSWHLSYNHATYEGLQTSSYSLSTEQCS